jgi:hypothetical protein
MPPRRCGCRCPSLIWQARAHLARQTPMCANIAGGMVQYSQKPGRVSALGLDYTLDFAGAHTVFPYPGSRAMLIDRLSSLTSWLGLQSNRSMGSTSLAVDWRAFPRPRRRRLLEALHQAHFSASAAALNTSCGPLGHDHTSRPCSQVVATRMGAARLAGRRRSPVFFAAREAALGHTETPASGRGFLG